MMLFKDLKMDRLLCK